MQIDLLSKLLPDMCKQIFSSGQASPTAMLWHVIATVWSGHWPWIVAVLIIWIIFEFFTRNGTAHYNSKNGFSPTFNTVIGSLVYFLFQTLAYFLLTLIFGSGIYCTPLPYIVHPIIFYLTWRFLIKIKFWVY